MGETWSPFSVTTESINNLEREEVKDMEKNLWESVGNKCLMEAEKILDKGITAPEQAVTVMRLVETAGEIDRANLRWAEQSRSGAAVYSRRAFEQTKAKD